MPDSEMRSFALHAFDSLTHVQIYQRGRDSYKEDNFNEAVRCFTYLLSFPHSPYSLAAFYWRAQAHFSLQQYKLALDDITVAVTNDRVSDNLRKHLFLRGKILFALTRYWDACKDFDRALAGRHDHSIYAARSRAYRAMGCPYLAIADLQAAIQYDPEPSNHPAYRHSIRKIEESLRSITSTN